MDKFLPDLVRRRLDPAARYGLRLTLFAAAVSLVAIPFAYLVVAVTSNDAIVQYDKAAADVFFELKLQMPFLSTVFNGISMLGHPMWFWVLIGGVAIYLWRRKLRRLVAFLLTSTIGGSLVNTAVKVTVDRARPTYTDPAAITFQTGKSFPSGHAMSSTIAYGALLLIFLPLVPRKYRPWAVSATITLVAVIGASRLGLGVHYISDVVGGFILGLAWLTASTAAYSIWRVERGRRPVDLMDGVAPEVEAKLHPKSD